jgi:F0F1-type ATP synthase gamma subunit
MRITSGFRNQSQIDQSHVYTYKASKAILKGCNVCMLFVYYACSGGDDVPIIDQLTSWKTLRKQTKNNSIWWDLFRFTTETQILDQILKQNFTVQMNSIPAELRASTSSLLCSLA